MKLAFTTLGCPKWTFSQILEGAEKLGYDAIEIRGIEGEMRAERMTQFMPGNQQETIRQLQAHNINICAIDTSVNFEDTSKLPAMLEEGRAAIDVCARMGIPFIRVFGDRIPQGESEESAAANVAAGIRALCDYAQGTQVGVLIETHGDFNRAGIIAAVAEQVNSDKFGVLWDIEHTDKIYGDKFEEFYRPIAKYVRHIHVKDYQHVDGGVKYCNTGEGDSPIAAIAAMLKADGYEGCWSFEWEKMWRPELAECETAFPKYIEYMRSL